MALRGADGRSTPFDALPRPARIKIVGRAADADGFLVESVQIEAMTDFSIEKLQGRVGGVDRDRRILNVAGVTVRVSPRTMVEGWNEEAGPNHS